MSTIAIPSTAPASNELSRGAKLRIDFDRFCPNYNSRTFDIDCEGPREWHYTTAGSYQGAQVSEGVDPEEVMEFGKALGNLVTEFFGNVSPLVDKGTPSIEKLTIDFDRICPNDKSGMVEIECEGPQGWNYSSVGSHHGAQVNEGVDHDKVMTFGAAVSKLVTRFFGEVRPLLDRNV